jgi:hypothetical protein
VKTVHVHAGSRDAVHDVTPDPRELQFDVLPGMLLAKRRAHVGEVGRKRYDAYHREVLDHD